MMMTEKKKITIPLRDVLQIDLLKGAEILAGEDGLDNSIVSVNVMEVPDVLEWVRSGEFLLTTAYVFRNDLSLLDRLIPDLHAQNVCGLGIKTQRYIETVPESALKLADELGFPIIRIPQEVPYGDLIKEIFNHIIGEQRDLLGRINEFNKTVREIMLKRGGMQEIAEQIYLATESSVIIHDDIFRDSYSHCPDEESKILVKEDYKNYLSQSLSNRDHHLQKNRNQEVSVGENGIKRYSIPIYFDNTHYGSILIWDTKNSLRPQSLFVIESITSLIALDILNRATLVERENIHQTGFLELLLSTDPADQEKAIESSKFYLFDQTRRSQIIVLWVGKDQGQAKPNDNTAMVQKLDTDLLYLTNRLKKEYKAYFLSTQYDDRAIFLLQFDENITEDLRHERCENFIEIILQFLEEKKKSTSAFIGVGSCAKSYKDLPASLRQAEQTVRILQNKNEAGAKVLFYEDLDVLQILGHPLIEEDALAYADEILSAIDEPDSKKRNDFYDTICAYFEAGGNLRRVSELLFTHYNTVVYRINRIRDVYGVDLRDPDTAFNFQLALKIRELLR
jgi:purine catabolism regulator